MIRHGTAPFLECSTKGDKRFSALYARLKGWDNRTIEDLYQSSKIFADGEPSLPWIEAKGRMPINFEEVSKLYTELWFEYLKENPHLIEVIIAASGLSDIFGQQNHNCQATVLWNIRCDYLEMTSSK